MSAPTLTHDELRALRPCKNDYMRITKLLGGAKKWNSVKISAAQARIAGATFDDILWAVSAIARSSPDVGRRLRLYLADYAARLLHIYERNYPTDDRCRNAIIASRKFARGEIEAKTLFDTYLAAISAARYAEMSVGWYATTSVAARAAYRAAAVAAPMFPPRDPARDAEKSLEFDRLVEWLGDNDPADYPIPVKAKAEAA